MPKAEVYQAIGKRKRVFFGRDAYLDYLRVRRRERISWTKRQANIKAKFDRLHAVRECQDWPEVIDFINSHASDIESICGYRIKDFSLRISGTSDYVPNSWGTPPRANEDGEYFIWKGHVEYSVVSYSNRHMDVNHWDRSEYDLPYRHLKHTGVNDVLDEIGINTNGGGGSSRHRYSVYIHQAEFDHLRVMERLAA